MDSVNQLYNSKIYSGGGKKASMSSPAINGFKGFDAFKGTGKKKKKSKTKSKK